MVSEDPSLEPVEKEFHIRASKSDERATVMSEIGSMTRAYLTRDDFEVDWVRTVDGDGAVELHNDIPDEDGREIVGIQGTVPLDVLKVNQKSREHGGLRRIVARHE